MALPSPLFSLTGSSDLLPDCGVGGKLQLDSGHHTDRKSL